jgi:hypothetical protein
MPHRNDCAAVACAQNIPAPARNIPLRRPGRLRAVDSPLAQRRLADKETVGPQLAAALTLDGADQTQLAIACGRDQGAVSRWHSPSSPDVPTLLDVRWAKLAGLHHWSMAAAGISLDGIVTLDEQTRAALLQARAAIDAVLGEPRR